MLEINVQNGIQIFRRHTITKTYVWVVTKTKCQFYKNTINGTDVYLIFHDDSKQWQIFKNLTKGKYGCPNTEKRNLLYYNHIGGEMIKSEGWLDYRKGKYYVTRQNITIHDLDKCSAYNEDKIENKICTNENPDHCEIVLSNGQNEAMKKCFQKDQRTARDINRYHHSEGEKSEQGFPYAAIIGVVVCGLLLVLSCWYYRKKKSLADAEPGSELNESNFFQNGEEKEIGHNIFMKKEDLKINVVNSMEDEKNIFKEFQKLEAMVAKCVTLVKSTQTPQEEKNARHNRYADIGKEHTYLL